MRALGGKFSIINISVQVQIRVHIENLAMIPKIQDFMSSNSINIQVL